MDKDCIFRGIWLDLRKVLTIHQLITSRALPARRVGLTDLRLLYMVDPATGKPL